MDWEEYFKQYTTSTILWSLNKGYLNFNGEKIYLHSVNRQSMLFLRAALDNNKKALLVYPSNNLDITSLLALEALYSKVYDKKRDKLLIISDRIALRNEIKKCFLSFRAGRMSLFNSYFPIGIISKTGKIIDVTRINIKPRLLISPFPEVLPDPSYTNEFFGIIVEITPNLSFDKLKFISDWAEKGKIQFIFYISSEPPGVVTIDLINEGILYWGWDSSSLYGDCQKDKQFEVESNLFNSQFCKNYQEIKQRSLGIKRLIIPVKEEELNKKLLDCRHDYLNLIQTAKHIGSNSAISLSKKFLNCIYSLEELTAPLSYAEKYYDRAWNIDTIYSRIDKLKRIANSFGENRVFESYLINSIGKLENTYDYYKNARSGKHIIIIHAIIEAQRKKANLAIISKNEPCSKALIEFLEKEKEMHLDDLATSGISFQTINSLDKIQNVQAILLYGCPRYYQRNLIDISFTKNIGILAFDSEKIPIRYIVDEIENNRSLFSFTSRAKSIGTIFEGGSDGIFKKVKQIEKPNMLDYSTNLILIDPQDAKIDCIDFKSTFANFLSYDFSIDMEYVSEVISEKENWVLGIKTPDSISAHRISLSGHKTILLESEKLIQIYNQGNEKVEDIKVNKLKKGDILILVNNSAKHSILDAIISRIEHHPKMIEIIAFQRSWIYHLKEGMTETGDTASILIEKLRERGAKSPNEPIAIYFWLSGKVLGPRDKENIKRIGEIYEKKFLIAHYNEINSAIKKLRGLHLSLARKIRWLIPRAGVVQNIEENLDNIIDENLDLYLEDFTNAITLEKVIDIEGPFVTSYDQIDKMNMPED